MQFYDVIENRKSIKQFKNTPIDRDKVARMINAAMMSPSWKNNTSYKFILVDDPMQKEELSNAVLNTTNEASNAIKQAPMAAVVVADPSLSGNVEGKQYYLADASIAMEHFVLAATNEGYGTCWIAEVDENKVRNTLSIPNDYKVVAVTPIGKSAENPQQHPKKDVKDYIFMNNWGKPYTENDYHLIQK
ncbi:nitroreductase family protein [Caldisalinibacter kiritimatiensis]|uniref:Nitroreductase domain-containing protein n=1 Tax=Caldisalinibacter kiritimatiensis TaxID=1304284 RepID=R1ATG1_9FIRM|nr:nitroreductase family protein [Caldisalinibacter kiritimatiensis]EOC99916.1 hypothetical protein L21TH_2027 [Caldisalinibacter kiritimatiensis]